MGRRRAGRADEAGRRRGGEAQVVVRVVNCRVEESWGRERHAEGERFGSGGAGGYLLMSHTRERRRIELL